MDAVLVLTVSFPHGKDQNKSLEDLKKLLFFQETEVNANKLLNSIIKTDVGHRFNDIVTSIPPKFESKLLNDFTNNHKSINYYRIFEQKKKSKRKDYFIRKKDTQKCDDQIHPTQLREGFQTILYKVVPKEFIGNNRNKKKILKALYNLLQTARTESFSLIPLMKQINVSSITWVVEKDPQKSIKYIVIAKFFKWLFQYFISLICYYYHITYIREERIFIFIKDWSKQKKNYLKAMDKRMVLELSNDVDIREVQSKLYLIPKRDGVRSIMRQKYTNDKKQELRKVLSVLKYLFDTYLKDTNISFTEQYLEIARQNNKLKEDVYIISADIRDAYGSIIQAKLFDIISALFDNLPNELTLQWFIRRHSKMYKFIDTQCVDSNKVVVIQKCYILKVVEDTIYNTKVRIHNKVYNLCKGVAQGLMLSAKLCDIYYAHMQRKHFSNFQNSGHLFTYVDDTIYITKNSFHAKKFLNRVEKGIPDYNCWFNKSKLISNVSTSSNPDAKNSNINYLGWKIYPSSLEIEPKYNAARYSMSYATSVDYTKLERKLKNHESIKLHKLVLCKEINSGQRIMDNVKMISLHQAKRCYAILNSLSIKQEILSKIISRTNFQMMRRIENLTKWNESEKRINRRMLKYIIWKSFHDIFHKKRKSFPDLCNEFKKLIKNHY